MKDSRPIRILPGHDTMAGELLRDKIMRLLWCPLATIVYAAASFFLGLSIGRVK